MPIEIAAIGGYGVVGRNMTAVRVNNEVVILDCGIHLPNYITLTEEEAGDVIKLDEKKLKHAGAVPQDDTIKDWWHEVKALMVSHAHLDHLGALPYLSQKYDAPIIATPFSCAVLQSICKDEGIKLPNQIRPLLPNSHLKLTPNITIQFIHLTHSTPQTVLIAIHTPEGVIAYGSDFKLDNSPILGKKPNYEALKELGDSGKVKALILEDLYAEDARKMPSEAIAKDMLRDVMVDVDSKGKAVIVTTFSSHIARLTTIVDLAEKLKRKVVFLGRSLAKFALAAEDSGVAQFTSRGVKILKYGRQVRQVMKELMDNRDKYVIVMTGHQGEPKAMLSKIVQNIYPFKFKPEDHVIFSSNTIPAEINLRNRAKLEAELKKIGVRMFTNIHVSGHCAREDLRDVIMLLKPKHLLPIHGEKPMNDAMIDLGTEQGYKLGKTSHALKEGERITIE